MNQYINLIYGMIKNISNIIFVESIGAIGDDDNKSHGYYLSEFTFSI